MPLCPVCKKEFKNVDKHIEKLSLKDDAHKIYLDSVSTKSIYSQGDLISTHTNEQFEVLEDLGDKLKIRRPNSNFLILTIKKEKVKNVIPCQ